MMCGSYFSVLPRGAKAHKEIGERNAIGYFCACRRRAGFAALRDVLLRLAHSAQEIKRIERSKLRTQPAFDCLWHRRGTKDPLKRCQGRFISLCDPRALTRLRFELE
jgi:hypothetical protein